MYFKFCSLKQQKKYHKKKIFSKYIYPPFLFLLYFIGKQTRSNHILIKL